MCGGRRGEPGPCLPGNTFDLDHKMGEKGGNLYLFCMDMTELETARGQVRWTELTTSHN